MGNINIVDKRLPHLDVMDVIESNEFIDALDVVDAVDVVDACEIVDASEMGRIGDS